MKLFLDANICLDLLDTTRPTSKASIDWYMSHKDDTSLSFYFSGDFITTFYYVLSECSRRSHSDTLPMNTRTASRFVLGHLADEYSDSFG